MTHTSPGQIHVMHTETPPIRALLPGRCFRFEAVDASHGFEFFQVEGLMARVKWMSPDDAPPRPRSHQVLGVMLEGETWLLDTNQQK